LHRNYSKQCKQSSILKFHFSSSGFKNKYAELYIYISVTTTTRTTIKTRKSTLSALAMSKSRTGIRPRMNGDILGQISKWIPEGSSVVGVLAKVNTDFNTEFQEASSEIRDAKEFDILNQYVDSDLQDCGFIHATGEIGLAAKGYNEHVFSEYFHGDHFFMVCIYRGPGSSLILSSEALGWGNYEFADKDAWDLFSPWVGLPELVDITTTTMGV
jgi:hypothetical protein